MLKISASLLAEIGRQGEASYPYEGCGLLLGRVEQEANVVADLYPIPNRWEVQEEKRVRFRIGEMDMLQAELVAAERGSGRDRHLSQPSGSPACRLAPRSGLGGLARALLPHHRGAPGRPG
jgi:hypothetical protein